MFYHLPFRPRGQRIALMLVFWVMVCGATNISVHTTKSPQVRKAIARGAPTGRYFSHQLMRFHCDAAIMTLHRPSILLTVAFQLLLSFLVHSFIFLLVFFFYFYFVFFKPFPLASKTRWNSLLSTAVGTPVATPHVRVSELLASIVT